MGDVYIPTVLYTSGAPMRTNIEIDDKLMAEVLKETGLPTKRAAVEEGLRMLLRHKRRRGILELRGKVDWQGDLDESRRS
jgi:Arc/MetJ family transcription regulator